MLSVRDNAIVDDLSLHFPTCQKFIDTGRKKGGVLVHWYDINILSLDLY